ncbi:SynChlorMet cassette radical SAM/SPASM protein ScmE [Desulfocicer niacini]
MKVLSSPLTIGLSITHKCNLKCQYCSHFNLDDATSNKEDLCTDKWTEFFQELEECRVRNVILQGGEPFVRQDIRKLIASIVEHNMRYSILTNGTLIDEKDAQFIATTNRCDIIQVSIDGSLSETHEACRGKGSFQKALRGLSYLIQNKVPVTARVTIHKYNMNDLPQISYLLLEELKLPYFSINEASYFGLCKTFSNDIQLSIDEKSTVMASLLKLKGKYNDRIQASAGPLAQVIKWKDMLFVESKKQVLLPEGGFLSACNGVFNKIDVRSDGVIVPCLLLDNIELGKINDRDLKNIWKHHASLKRLRSRKKIPLTEFEYCRDCNYIYNCKGSCPALALSYCGDPYVPDQESCLRYFLENGGRLPNNVY